MRGFSLWSLIVTGLGAVLLVMPFTFEIPVWLQPDVIILIGLFLILSGFVLGLIAFFRRENGWIKYLSLLVLILFLGFMLFFASILGAL